MTQPSVPPRTYHVDHCPLNHHAVGDEAESTHSFGQRTAVRSALFILTSLLLLLAGSPVRAQQATPDEESGVITSTLQQAVSGRVGLAFEAYGAGGMPNRRPPTSTRLFASTSFNLFGLSSGLNLTYSTESDALRQSMNRLAFDTQWSWGRASAGSVSPTLSAYSLNGETVQGGLLELSPGPLVVTAAVGRAQRAVSPSSSERLLQPAYERWLYAARLGVGERERTHFHLIGLLVRDDTSSIDASDPIAEGVRPVSNVSLTPSLGVAPIDGIHIQAQVTASAFTRDRTANELDLSDTPVPDFVTSLADARSSTRIDWAGQAEAMLDFQRFGLRLGYDRVQPGFESLGAGRLRSDQETIQVRPRVRLVGGKLDLNGQFRRTRNNLLDHRLVTLVRRQVGLNASVRPMPQLAVSGSFQQYTNASEPTASAQNPELLEQRQVMRTFTLAPTVSVRAGSATHSFSLSGMLQTFASERPQAAGGSDPGLDYNSLTSTLTYALGLPSGLSVNGTANWLRRRGGRSEVDVIGLNAGAGYTLFDGAMTANLNGGYSQTQNTLLPAGEAPDTATPQTSRQLTINLGGSYRLPWESTLRLRMRGLANHGAGGRSFREMRGELRYEHRF